MSYVHRVGQFDDMLYGSINVSTIGDFGRPFIP